MKVYFDTCALGRLTDDPREGRVLREAMAVQRILELLTAEVVVWVASPVLEAEANRNPYPIQREEMLAQTITRIGRGCQGLATVSKQMQHF